MTATTGDYRGLNVAPAGTTSSYEPTPSVHQAPLAGRVLSGKQLRERVITPEVLAAMDVEEPTPTLLQRLFKRK